MELTNATKPNVKLKINKHISDATELNPINPCNLPKNTLTAKLNNTTLRLNSFK